jgi:Kef-type K+ transport system membrane component KefB
VWTVESLTTLASMGVILLLFLAGLETRVADMLRVGGRALAVATVGVVAPSLLGYLTSALLSAPYLPPAFAASPWKVHLFVGATLCATSVGITARVLQDCGRLRSREGHIILGAAVIDDVLGLIVLAIVLGVAAPGATLTLGAVGWIAAKATLFLGAALYLGVRLTPTLTRLAAMMRTAGMKLIYSLLFCFLLAWAASRIGLAAIVGAFAAGLVLDEVHFRDFRGEERTVEDLVRPIGQLLVPVFFVLMGIQIKLESLVTGWSVLVLGLLLLVAAWVGKQACALATGPGVDRLVVGLGMVPRGEVGLIFVAMGKQAGLMTDTLFSALVLTVMLTTLVTPPLLSWRFRRRAAATP